MVRDGSDVYELFYRMGPPEFMGTSDPIEAENWIIHLEKIFVFMECSFEKKVSLATFILKGEAEHWWRATHDTL